MTPRRLSRLDDALDGLPREAHLAKARVWNRIQARTTEARRQQDRRRWYLGAACAAAISLAFVLPSTAGYIGRQYMPSTEETGSIAVNAMLEDLFGPASGAETSDQQLQEFVTFLVMEAEQQARQD